MTQRPALFGAAIPAVGVLDMLRYHEFTIGWAWADDYGTSADSPEMFNYLKNYSPVHNLNVRYPTTMITTADHDDRVVPAHSTNSAATLQKAHEGENPVLIRIEKSAQDMAAARPSQNESNSTRTNTLFWCAPCKWKQTKNWAWKTSKPKARGSSEEPENATPEADAAK